MFKNNGKANGQKFELSFKIVLFTITFTTISILLVYNLLLVKKTDLYSSQYFENTLDSYLKLLVNEIDDDKQSSKDNLPIFLEELQSFIEDSKGLISLTVTKENKDEPAFYKSISEGIVLIKNDSKIKRLEIKKQLIGIIESDNYKRIDFNFRGRKISLHFSIYDNLAMLKLLPFIQLIVLTFLIFLTYFGYRFFKSSKESSMWVAMAKETAHQLGTPITSLSGWNDYLHEIKSDFSKDENSENSLVVQKELELELKEIHEGLGVDINRINLILERFSKIASEPEMGYYKILDLVNGVVDYLRSRIPNKDNRIEIRVNFEGDKEIADIYLSKILIEWTIENLIKNSLQSIEFDKKGVVEIFLKENKKKVIIDIIDNGKGIKSNLLKQIFTAGYTTKKRGWGIGLSLAKRVIEEYHNGKLYIVKSKISVGTTIRIELNKFI